jgi:hypothetical protein
MEAVKPKIGRCIVFHGAPHTALPNDDKRLVVSGNIKFS